MQGSQPPTKMAFYTSMMSLKPHFWHLSRRKFLKHFLFSLATESSALTERAPIYSLFIKRNRRFPWGSGFPSIHGPCSQNLVPCLFRFFRFLFEIKVCVVKFRQQNPHEHALRLEKSLTSSKSIIFRNRNEQQFNEITQKNWFCLKILESTKKIKKNYARQVWFCCLVRL